MADKEAQFYVVNKGTSSYELRIDTDGPNGNPDRDKYWQGQTSSGVDSYKIPFVVVPGGSYTMFGRTSSAGGWMGYICSVYDPSTKRTVWGICGDVGPSGTAWREVSIKLARDLGYTNVGGNVSAPAHKYVITVYNKQLKSGHRTLKDIQSAVKNLGGVITSGDTNIAQAFLDEAASHLGEGGDWVWQTSGVVQKPNAWCAGFITAVAKKVGILNKVIAGNCSASEVIRQSVKKGYGTFNKGPYHGESATPHAGDLVIFRYRDAVNYRHNDEYDANHVAIVYSVTKDNKNFTTIGGNEGGRGSANNVVKKNTYKTSYKSVVGFYTPNWSEVGGLSPGGGGAGTYGPLFAVTNTREDAIVREVGYLNKDFEPSINVSDIRLSVINYTSMLGDIFDIVREQIELQFDLENDETNILDGGLPSDSETINLLWPVPDHHTISSPFGWRSRGWHSGLDISTARKENQRILAAEKGTVVVAQPTNSTGYGHYIVIEHDKKTKSGQKVWTLYAHNNDLLVKKGDRVERGVQIAKSGTTGNSTGPHLHFEVRLGNNQQSSAVNPYSWIHGHDK